MRCSIWNTGNRTRRQCGHGYHGCTGVSRVQDLDDVALIYSNVTYKITRGMSMTIVIGWNDAQPTPDQFGHLEYC